MSLDYTGFEAYCDSLERSISFLRSVSRSKSRAVYFHNRPSDFYILTVDAPSEGEYFYVDDHVQELHLTKEELSKITALADPTELILHLSLVADFLWECVDEIGSKVDIDIGEMKTAKRTENSLEFLRQYTGSVQEGIK